MRGRRSLRKPPAFARSSTTLLHHLKPEYNSQNYGLSLARIVKISASCQSDGCFHSSGHVRFYRRQEGPRSPRLALDRLCSMSSPRQMRTNALIPTRNRPATATTTASSPASAKERVLVNNTLPYAKVNAIMLKGCSISPTCANACPKKLLEVYRNFLFCMLVALWPGIIQARCLFA